HQPDVVPFSGGVGSRVGVPSHAPSVRRWRLPSRGGQRQGVFWVSAFLTAAPISTSTSAGGRYSGGRSIRTVGLQPMVVIETTSSGSVYAVSGMNQPTPSTSSHGENSSNSVGISTPQVTTIGGSPQAA